LNEDGFKVNRTLALVKGRSINPIPVRWRGAHIVAKTTVLLVVPYSKLCIVL